MRAFDFLLMTPRRRRAPQRETRLAGAGGAHDPVSRRRPAGGVELGPRPAGAAGPRLVGPRLPARRLRRAARRFGSPGGGLRPARPRGLDGAAILTPGDGRGDRGGDRAPGHRGRRDRALRRRGGDRARPGRRHSPAAGRVRGSSVGPGVVHPPAGARARVAGAALPPHAAPHREADRRALVGAAHAGGGAGDDPAPAGDPRSRRPRGAVGARRGGGGRLARGGAGHDRGARPPAHPARCSGDRAGAELPGRRDRRRRRRGAPPLRPSLPSGSPGAPS